MLLEASAFCVNFALKQIFTVWLGIFTKRFLYFIREAMAKFSNLRQVILDRLLEAFNSIRSAKVHRAALWILGEYCSGAADIQAVMNEVRQSLGEIPIVEDELRKAAGEEQVGEGGLGMVSVLCVFFMPKNVPVWLCEFDGKVRKCL